MFNSILYNSEHVLNRILLLKLNQVINLDVLLQLTTEERLYLHAARVGDYCLLREILDCAAADQCHQATTGAEGCGININCIDYMGRNALHLAVDSENMECIELLLDRLSWDCVEEVVRLYRSHPCIGCLALSKFSAFYFENQIKLVIRQLLEYKIQLTK